MASKISAMIAGAGLVVAGAVLRAAPTTVTGVLVDQACYTKDHANTGMAHKGMSEMCAQECAKRGQPVALVTDKGEVYEVMAMGELAGAKNAKLVPHMSHTVALTGDVMDMNGRKMIHATSMKMVSK